MANINASYNKEQQIHSLSLLSNAAFGQTFPNSAAIDAYVAKVVSDSLANSTIQGYIGTDWTVVWGPVVYSHNAAAASLVADNTMLLFYSPGQNLFVVTIAGTNIDSMYGWLQEDFSVNSLVTWQTVIGTGVTVPQAYATASISAGANNGLQALLSMGDPNNNNVSMLQALSAYISSKQITGAELAVAGHSLGGALTPCMALYMQTIQQDANNNWNSGKGVSTISAWPTAGPTPGEAVFAQYYESLIGANFVYTSRYNSIDVVPQAWQLSSMQNVPTIYDDHITSPKPDSITGPLVVGAMLRTLDSNNSPINYTQISPWNQLPGTFSKTVNFFAGVYVQGLVNDAIPTSSSLATYGSAVVSLASFLAQLGYQHTSGYYGETMLNISGFASEYSIIKKDASPTGQTDEELHAAALRKALGNVMGNIAPTMLAKGSQVAQN